MTNKQQTEPPTVQPTPAPASAVSATASGEAGAASTEATAPHQISEQDRRSLQEAYRMIHAIAADIEDEKRRNTEEGASAEDRTQKEATACQEDKETRTV